MPWITEAQPRPQLTRPKQISLKESGFGLVSTAVTGMNTVVDNNKKKKLREDPNKPFKKYVTAYKGVPIVAAAIDKTVDFVVSPGFYIDSESEEDKKEIEDFLDKINFDIFLRGIVKDMLLFGDSFVEIVGTGKSIDELNILNPEFMRVIRKAQGSKVTGYYQDVPQAKKNKDNPWSPNQIAHFIHNKIADSPYGVSIIEPIETILDIKINMEKAMKTILERKANAPYHARLGDTPAGYPATQSDIDSFTNDLQSLTNKTNWVTGDLCNIEAIGVKSKIIDIQPFTEHIDNQMVFGLEVPYVLLGKGNVPEGLASVQLEAMDRRAKSIQMLISSQVEDKIFSKYGAEKKTYLKWGQPSKVTEQAEIATYLEMMNSSMSPEFRQAIEDEIRKITGIGGKAPDYKQMEKEKSEQEQGPYQDYVKKSKTGVDGNPDRRKEKNLPGKKK